ncbi:MAG: VOC family protein [Anaerolineae bacterium]
MQLYEVHMPVSDLAASIEFYSRVLGLELAYEQPHRGVAFMWIGSREKSMLGLWAPGSPYGWKDGNRFKSHFAISIPLDELLATPARLRGLAVEPRGFGGEPTDEPSVIGWMPSAQVYFADPDSHSLEYITVLDEAPKPNFKGSWAEWCAQR